MPNINNSIEYKTHWFIKAHSLSSKASYFAQVIFDGVKILKSTVR